MRKPARWTALALVLVTTVLGSINTVDELVEGETFLQRSVGVAVAAYTMLGWLILFGVWRRQRWAWYAGIAWTAATVWAASVSTFAWGGAPIGASIAAGAGCLLAGAWIVWAVRDSVSQPVAVPESRV